MPLLGRYPLRFNQVLRLLVRFDRRQTQLQMVGTLPLHLKRTLVPLYRLYPQRTVIRLRQFLSQIVDVLAKLYRSQQHRLLLQLKVPRLLLVLLQIWQIQYLPANQSLIWVDLYQVLQ